MVEADGRGIQHGFQSLPLDLNRLAVVRAASPKVRRQHFNRDQWIALADRLHGTGEEGRAMVLKIVAGDSGEHHITQSHAHHGISHPLGFSRVQRLRCPALVHLTERTTPRADGPSQQKCCGPGGVALAPIRAASLLTDGVKGIGFDKGLNPLDRRGVAHRSP